MRADLREASLPPRRIASPLPRPVAASKPGFAPIRSPCLMQSFFVPGSVSSSGRPEAGGRMATGGDFQGWGDRGEATSLLLRLASVMPDRSGFPPFVANVAKVSGSRSGQPQFGKGARGWEPGLMAGISARLRHQNGTKKAGNIPIAIPVCSGMIPSGFCFISCTAGNFRQKLLEWEGLAAGARLALEMPCRVTPTAGSNPALSAVILSRDPNKHTASARSPASGKGLRCRLGPVEVEVVRIVAGPGRRRQPRSHQ
jgi:hypothetical protein